MSDTDNSNTSSENSSEQWMNKADMIQRMSDKETAARAQRKSLVISSAGEQPADVMEIAKSLEIQQDSNVFAILKIFCEQGKSTDAQARTFAQRVVPLSDEHNNFLKRMCECSGFTAQNILDLIASLKKISGKGLLLLHGFAEVKGFGPGPLNRFFMATTPQLDRKKATAEALKQEKQTKAISSAQIDLFYNICLKLPDLNAETTLAVLPRIRLLKEQHARMLNLFLDKDACFDEKPITNQILPSLIKLWSGLPEIADKNAFEKLIKKLSSQPDEKKQDFKFLTQAFKREAEKKAEQGSRIGNVFKQMLQ